MSKPSSELTTQRRQIVSDLTDNIINTATPLIDPEVKSDDLGKVRDEIEKRIHFEANVALNEVVTRFSPKRAREIAEATTERSFTRFGKNFRSQHMLMFVSVVLLILTGMPLKFPEFAISRFMVVDLFGGLNNSTTIHRVAAVGLIIVGVWHLGYIFAARMGRRDFLLMIPTLQDAKDAYNTILFYIGKRASGPKFHRFSFIEKFDYWAVYWGMVVMIGSGLILWFKEIFPKDIFDIAREAHSDEGLLATLAIIIWHFYNVHFNPDVFPMSWVWWHGKLSESEMKHHHPLEYAEILEAERKSLEQDDNESNRKK